jgi:hypothetical protein
MTVTYSRPSAFTQLTATSDWEALFSAAGIHDGIDGTQSIGTMTPSLDTSGRNAVIQAGNVVVKGQLWSCSGPISTPIPGASSQNRYDRLVLRLNRGATTAPTVIQPTVITGAPASSPVEPPLVQTTTGLYDIPVCSWLSTSSGSLSNLVDERQYSVDAWHTLTTPTSPGGLSGSFRYRQTGAAVRMDVTLQWTSVNTWNFPNIPSNYQMSMPGPGGTRIYTMQGNAPMPSSGGQLSRLYLALGGAIQFISEGGAGYGSLSMDVPMN